jgi:hypothetical protein
MRCKKGQSILEYVIVLTVIVGAVIVGAVILAGKGKSQDGSDARGVGKLMYKSAETIKAATGKVAGITP